MVMNKTIRVASFMMAVFCLTLTGQEDQCPNFKVAISCRNVINDSTLFYLNKIHNRNLTLDAWISEIDAKFVEELNNAGYNDLDFFAAESNPGADRDILFAYDIILWKVNKDNPDNKYADAYFKDGVLYFDNQKIVFRIRSQVDIISNCIPTMTSPIINKEWISDDIFLCVKNVVGLNWPLDRQIWYWESQHLAPARKPRMFVYFEKNYLSLLDQDSRRMNVTIKVKNCREQYVYNQFQSQPVYFEKETERLHSKSSIKCTDGPDRAGCRTILTNKDYEAICEYSIKNGMEPGREMVHFFTCGIGSASSAADHEIIIRGLELLVEPWRNTIHNGEKTTISIDLHEKDPDGSKYPAVDQEVEIKVTGIVDGALSPEGKVTTDEMGVAWIDYKAGKEDKQIKITATFTPPGYSEKVTADATITVKPLEYDATLTLKGSYKKTEKSHYETKNSWGDNENTLETEDFREASFYVPLKMVDAYDVEVQNLRYELYQPLDINLSHFNASFKSTEYQSSIAPDQGSKTTIIRKKTASDRKISIKEVMLQNHIVMTLDLKTGKVRKIDLDGFAIGFTWNETIDIHKDSWWQPPPQPGHETIDDRQSSKSDDSFQVGPVEDPVPDPTIKSSSEEIMNYLKEMGIPLPADADINKEEEVPKIEPDLLVKFGDGKSYFGGEGSKIIDNSEGSTVNREEFSFSWQATRKKKPL
jgi:hypothetical protein